MAADAGEPPRAPAAVRISALSHRYGKVNALSDISFEVPVGATVGLVGPDGVGKSTLLGVIAGAKRIQDGRVEVLGGDMADVLHRRRVGSRIAFMPQGLGKNLYATLTVTENIDFFARLFGLDRRETQAHRSRLLEATGLAPFAGRAAGKLSGGMKQKLGLCCALIHDPDLLVLDEPTTGVDPLSRRQFWALIDRIRSDRPEMTMIVATAYMEEAERFAHLAAMDAGRLLAFGPTKDLIAATGAERLGEAYAALRNHGKAAPPKLAIPPLRAHDGPPAIVAEGFGDFVAVDRVSFRIARGEIFGFLGSNGCGKTTTMKMLTGLLPVSAGRAELLGRPVQAQDMAARLRVGYMSQTFSLYDELSVRANLALHARLYRVPSGAVEERVAAALERFRLAAVADTLPGQLPLGVRQRLQLAAACLHRPEVLILDEPTSGVDPESRDDIWRLIVELSRRDGVTVFISTHFMDEAERCDRVTLMHRGRTLSVGSPADIVRAEGALDLEEAFIRQISRDDPETARGGTAVAATTRPEQRQDDRSHGGRFLTRPLAFAHRELLELLRDPVRLAFALLGPVFLMIVFGFGVSFDVDQLTFGVLDRDQSLESRTLVENFQGSRYFVEQPRLASEAEIDRRLASGELKLVLEIPDDFGRDLLAGRRPEIGVFIDGAMPFRAETIRGYVDGIALAYAQSRAASGGAVAPISIEPRFRYNQDFRSAVAIVPGVIMMLLMLIPAMMTAVGVVREKELGSISNLYVAPAGIGEFLIGKQLPYILIGWVAFLLLVGLSALVFGLLPKGSFAALAVAALLYVWASAAFGLLVSAFVSTQVAAIFAAAILSIVPTVNFSGLLYPTASLQGASWWIGKLFPASWFQTVSLGVFDKALGFADLLPQMAALGGFGVAFLVAARLCVRKQSK
jgi:ribosome-dependent ATPase